MTWIAPSEQAIATVALEKRLWDAAAQFRANPPFNVNAVDKDRLKDRVGSGRRFPFGLPRTANANYAVVVACVSSYAFVAEASATANGAKMSRVNWGVLEKFPVAIPKGKVAERASTLFADVIAQQQSLIFQIQNLRRTRDLLPPRLLSEQVELKTEAA